MSRWCTASTRARQAWWCAWRTRWPTSSPTHPTRWVLVLLGLPGLPLSCLGRLPSPAWVVSGGGRASQMGWVGLAWLPIAAATVLAFSGLRQQVSVCDASRSCRHALLPLPLSRRSRCLCATSPSRWPQPAVPTRELPGEGCPAGCLQRLLSSLQVARCLACGMQPGLGTAAPTAKPSRLDALSTRHLHTEQAGWLRDARPGGAGQHHRGRDCQCGAGRAARADQPGAG